MRITKRIVSLTLAVILVFGLLPAAAMATEAECVYLSVSFDGKYIDDKNGNPIAYVSVPLDTIAAVDLAEYGLDNMLFDGDGDGNYDTTALQLLIYAHEELYGGDWSEVNFDALPGSSYFAGGIFGFTENLVYFHNGDFPVDESQASDYMTVGATSDRIVLEAGDYLDVASFSCYAFLWDQLGGFHLFADPNGNYVHDYAATKDKPLTVKLKHSFCDLMYGQSWIKDATDFEVYYGKTFGQAEGSVVTDENGCAEITFPDAGVYYVWCDGGNGSDDGTHGGCDYYYDVGEPCIVSSPAFAKVTVAGAAHTHTYEAVVTPPACTEGGFTTYTCACGDSYTAEPTEALGHDHQSEHFDGNPGYTKYTCSRCNDSYTVDDKVQKDLAVTKQPEGAGVVYPNTWITMSVEAEGGEGELTYRWQKRRVEEGAKWTWTNSYGPTAEFKTSKWTHYEYRCRVIDEKNKFVYTEPAGWEKKDSILQITEEPTYVLEVNNGENVTFSVKAESDCAISYQWYRKNKGADTFTATSLKESSFTVTAQIYAEHEYYCVVTDEHGGRKQSKTVSFRTRTTELLFPDLDDTTIAKIGDQVTYDATATSYQGAVSYRWQKSTDGGATFKWTGCYDPVYTITSNKTRTWYRCMIMDGLNVPYYTDWVTYQVNS